MSDNFFGEPISVYTKDDAVADGSQAKMGSINGVGVYFTSNLLFDGYEDEGKAKTLIDLGLQSLKKPDEEDTEYMKLRVLVEGKIWVIQALDGITFMKPEDY